MSIDGDSPRQLTNSDLGYATFPNWSPDGKYIVFQLSKKNKEDADIYTIDVDGEYLKQRIKFTLVQKEDQLLASIRFGDLKYRSRIL